MIEKPSTSCKPTRMMRISLILLSILTACFKDETVSGQTGDADIWVLETMNDIKVSSNITITFPEEGQIAGQAPCNKYFGTQTAPMPWFEIKKLGATKTACPELNLETRYFKSLQEMTTAEIVHNMLILRADAGNSMIFVNK